MTSLEFNLQKNTKIKENYKIDHLKITIKEARIYLIENYDKKGIKYRKK